jgi:hypothetical protein
MQQSWNDPCYYFKVYSDGTRLDAGIYVDDAWLADNAGSLADADLAKLSKRFEIKIDENPRHFLGMNVHVESHTRVRLTSEAYILKMADTYLPDWRSRAKVKLPADDRLSRAYERAHAREHVVTEQAVKSYRGKVGALVYTSPCVRVDTCYAISRLSRALTFPTAELDSLADEVMLFLAQTASDGLTFDGHAANAATLTAQCDSDWAVAHSTSGYHSRLAGACVSHASKRQTCVASSSTEAEIIAASACALQVKHFKALLLEMGLPQESVQLDVDNDGAVELSRDRKSCHRSRHVDRRYFKVRELTFEGVLHVERIDTKENAADLLTKALPEEAFYRHRAYLMNLPRS